MHFTVGDHRFSEMDARRTLRHADEFLAAFGETVRPFQTARRERIAAAMEGLDVGEAQAAELEPVLHAVWIELLAARDDAVAAEALPETTMGRVDRVSVSDGGVPKQAVDSIEVRHGGVVGDRQGSRRHHGAPFQALCLWNTETIDELAAHGHPIAAGDAGENITLSGFDWPRVRPGVRLMVGSALCEISSYAEPCKKNAQWFSDGDFTRIHDRNGPWSRIYATVLQPGVVAVGDAAVLEP